MRCVSSLHLYKGISRGEFDTSGLREFLEELSSPLCATSLLSSFWLSSHIWSRASDFRGNSTYRTLLRYRIPSPNTSSAALLDWIRKESWCVVRVRVLWRTACVALYHCAGVVALASWHRGTMAFWRRVLHNLEVDYVTSSSTHVGAGGVIPAIGLWGYISESLSIITALLDRYIWAI
jgi:hypothetical protein